MDAYTESHLARWAKGYFWDDEERDEAMEQLRKLVAEEPELLETRSWPEMLAIIEAA